MAGIAKDLPPLDVIGPRSGKLLVVGWGGTHGAICSAVQTLVAEGYPVGYVNLRHLNPLPPELGDIIKGFDKHLVPELNNGQLSVILCANYSVNTVSMNKIKGRPFKVSEIRERILELLNA